MRLISTSELRGPVLEWAESILEERQQALADLEEKYNRQEIPEDEYLSCRRSLQQAVSEIAKCLRQAPKPAFVRIENIKQIG